MTFRILVAFLLGFSLISCTTTTDTFNTSDNTPVQTISPVSGAKIPHKILKKFKTGLEIRNGGFGSAASAHPSNEREFYAITDRGPNVEHPKGRMFPIAIFSPLIGHFRLNEDGSVSVVDVLNLKRPNSKPITGLPNPKKRRELSREHAFDIHNKVLPLDPYGLSPEGLVATANGEFWVSDHYGPHIVRFDASGKELERISPLATNTSGHRLPAVLAKRHVNKGMSGLTLSNDGRTLFGIMQSTLSNPSKSRIINRSLTRIISYDVYTGKTKQFLYRQSRDNLSNSDIVALDDKTFLVLERDDKFLGKHKNVIKRLYKISLKGATDVSALSQAALSGRLINGKTLEQLSWVELAKQNIHPVEKELAIDLVSEHKYPHDKPEGLWLVNTRQLGILNDDDFAIAISKSKAVQKKLSDGQEDAGRIYILPIPK